MITKKVRLIIPKDYENKFFQFFGASRYAYNWALEKDISLDTKESDIRKEFTKFKKQEENKWMYEINNDVFKQSIRDYYVSRKNYFNKNTKARRPVKKKKGKCKDSFYIDVLKIKIFDDNTVYIPCIGTFKFVGYDLPIYYKKVINKKETYIGIRPKNPRVTYDGLYFYLSLSYEEEIFYQKPIQGRTIGIDLGLKTFANICINDNGEEEFYEVKSLKKKYKILSNKRKRIQRKISKRVLENKKKGNVTKSKNHLKLLKRQLKITHRITNIQRDLIYETIAFLVKSKPEKIVIEDLNIKGMMKNKKLSKWISFNQFYEFRRILEYKCEQFGINLVIADRFYPSSKTCSHCGNVKKKLSLSERVYKCEHCGLEMDRDQNAALNLSRL